MKKENKDENQKNNIEDKDLEDYYNNIEIPKELSFVVRKGIEKGKYISKNKTNKSIFRNLKIACSFALVITLGVVGYNLNLRDKDKSIAEKSTEINDEILELPHVKNEAELVNLLSKSNMRFSVAEKGETTDGVGTSIQEDSRAEKDNYSKTNNQEELVDEGDIVKTDGKYIYTTKNDPKSVSNGIVIIVKGEEPQNMEVMAKLDLEGYIKEIYITENKLIALSEVYENGTKTNVYIYNKEDATNLKLDRKLVYSGSNVSSRLVENKLTMVVNYQQYYRYYDVEGRVNTNEDGENKQTNIYLPRYYDSITDKEVVTSVQDIKYLPDTPVESIITLTSIDVENSEEEVETETLLASTRNIYSTKDNLYITGTGEVDYRTFGPKIAIEDANSSIYKFSLTGAELNLVAKGQVKGRVLNQFSMDESGETFRIATTSGVAGSSSNNIYILDKNLKEIGKLEGLAEQEKIYSVRFMENTAYMVTFKQVDPLFVIDLKDDKNPVVKGELKIPGFSSYLHPLDNETLIGFGEEREGDGLIRKGLKLSLFDVKDETQPIEKSTIIIGNGESYSEVLYDHKGFFLNKEKSIVGIPISQYSNGVNNSFIYLAKFSKEEGFKKLGELKINSDDHIDNYGYKIRVIYIGDNLYVVTNEGVTSYNMETLESINQIKY